MASRGCSLLASGGVPRIFEVRAVWSGLLWPAQFSLQLPHGRGRVLRRRLGTSISSTIGAKRYYARSVSIGWESDWSSVLDANQNLVRFLQSEEDAVRVEDLREHAGALGSGPRAPILAVPLQCATNYWVSHCAARTPTVPTSDELSLLKLLAIEASRTFDHLETLRLREALSEMQTSA